MAIEISGIGPMRLYAAGNDYPSDVLRRPVSGQWIASSYLDGIYTKAEAGYVTGGWNKYFQTVLPQDEWTSAASGQVFPKEYATTYVVKESAHNVSAYAETDGVEGLYGKVIEPETEPGSQYPAL